MQKTIKILSVILVPMMLVFSFPTISMATTEGTVENLFEGGEVDTTLFGNLKVDSVSSFFSCN